MFTRKITIKSFVLIVIALTLNACDSEKQVFEKGYANKYNACIDNPNPNPYSIKTEFDYDTARCKCNNNEPCELGQVCGIYGQCEGIREKCDHSTCDFDSITQTNIVRLCDTEKASGDSSSTGNVIAKYNCPNNTICNSSGNGCTVPCSGEEFRCTDNNHYQKCEGSLWSNVQECADNKICDPNGGSNICTTTCEENAEFCDINKNLKYTCNNNEWRNYDDERCDNNRCSDGTFTCVDGEIKICVNGSLISQTPKEQCNECISISSPTSDGYNRLFYDSICKQCESGSFCNTTTNKYDQCINGLYTPTDKDCNSTLPDDCEYKCENNNLKLCDKSEKVSCDENGCCTAHNKKYYCNGNSKPVDCVLEEELCKIGNCISSPKQPECTTDADCGEGNKCDEGKCVEPMPLNCSGMAYICHEGQIYQCEDDIPNSEPFKNPNGPICIEGMINNCTANVFESSNHVCDNVFYCEGNEAEPKQCLEDYSCSQAGTQCVPNSSLPCGNECGGDTPKCNESSNQCVECLESEGNPIMCESMGGQIKRCNNNEWSTQKLEEAGITYDNYEELDKKYNNCSPHPNNKYKGGFLCTSDGDTNNTFSTTCGKCLNGNYNYDQNSLTICETGAYNPCTFTLNNDVLTCNGDDNNEIAEISFGCTKNKDKLVFDGKSDGINNGNEMKIALNLDYSGFKCNNIQSLEGKNINNLTVSTGTSHICVNSGTGYLLSLTPNDANKATISDVQECANGCKNAFECKPECPKKTRCINGNAQIQKCENGVWVNIDTCPEDHSCNSNNECGECKDGTYKCHSDNYKIIKCANGSWPDPTGSSLTCNAPDQCTFTTPSEKSSFDEARDELCNAQGCSEIGRKCEGDVLVTCSSPGSIEARTDCTKSDDGYFCDEDKENATASCERAIYRCLGKGDTIEYFNSSHTPVAPNDEEYYLAANNNEFKCFKSPNNAFYYCGTFSRADAKDMKKTCGECVNNMIIDIGAEKDVIEQNTHVCKDGSKITFTEDCKLPELTSYPTQCQNIEKENPTEKFCFQVKKGGTVKGYYAIENKSGSLYDVKFCENGCDKNNYDCNNP